MSTMRTRVAARLNGAVWLDLVTDESGAVVQVIAHDEAAAPFRFILATPAGTAYPYTIWPHERERNWYYPLGMAFSLGGPFRLA